MAFIDHVLQAPSYGWQNEKGELVKPTTQQLFKEIIFNLFCYRYRTGLFGMDGHHF